MLTPKNSSAKSLAHVDHDMMLHLSEPGALSKPQISHQVSYIYLFKCIYITIYFIHNYIIYNCIVIYLYLYCIILCFIWLYVYIKLCIYIYIHYFCLYILLSLYSIISLIWSPRIGEISCRQSRTAACNVRARPLVRWHVRCKGSLARHPSQGPNSPNASWLGTNQRWIKSWICRLNRQ